MLRWTVDEVDYLAMEDMFRRTISTHRHPPPQLLQQLTCQRRLDALVCLDLATGKLPQSTLMLVERSLGDQHALINATNDGCSDMDSFHFRTSCRALLCQR